MAGKHDLLPGRRRSVSPLRLVVLVAVMSLPTGAIHAGELSFDLLFGADPGGRQPTQIAWSPEGRRLGYVWSDDAGAALWTLDAATGQRRAVLRLGGDDGELRTVDGYSWSPDGQHLLIASDGGLWELRLADLQLTPYPATEGAKQIPAWSPDGRSVAWVERADLHVLERGSGETRRLTEGGEPGRLLNAITDWVYWEEIWGRRATGFWWSPDSRRIAYYQFDETGVDRYPLVDFQEIPYPAVEWQRYPKAGSANPRVRLGVVDLASGETVWIDTGAEPDVYLARIDWRPDGRLVIQRLSREQDRLDLLLCDPADGSCRLLFEESWPTWVNLTEDLTFLPDGRFVRSSDRSGWRRLYLHGPDGRELRALTPENLAVTSLDALNADDGWLVYTAHGTGPLGAKDRQVFRGSLEGGVAEPLTPAAGWHAATVAAPTGHWVHRWSGIDRPTELAVRDLGGERVADLPNEPPRGYSAEALPSWEFLTIPNEAGEALPAAILRPADFEPDGSYPAIMYHYGGPGSQVVADRWGARGRGLWHKMMAERGYVVLMVDNLASRHFGKHGEDRAHRRFGEINLAAQRAGVDFLATLGTVDVDRIGLWGWSGGGTHTLYSVFNSPGTWRAAVAGAPVTDWRLYDTIWTERYLDHPDDNAEGYRLSSPVTHAAGLRDALLVVHGTADDNVHPQNTLTLSHALIQAGRSFEQAIYPRQKHGFRGDASRHFYERMTGFFDRFLGGSGEP